MINFKYDILFGLMFWEIKDAPRKPHYFSTEHLIPFTAAEHQHIARIKFNRTQNK